MSQENVFNYILQTKKPKPKNKKIIAFLGYKNNKFK